MYKWILVYAFGHTFTVSWVSSLIFIKFSLVQLVFNRNLCVCYWLHMTIKINITCRNFCLQVQEALSDRSENQSLPNPHVVLVKPKGKELQKLLKKEQKHLMKEKYLLMKEQKKLLKKEEKLLKKHPAKGLQVWCVFSVYFIEKFIKALIMAEYKCSSSCKFGGNITYNIVGIWIYDDVLYTFFEYNQIYVKN